MKYAKKKNNVRSGIRTHASIRRPERPPPLLNGKVYDHLESGALDRSAILTSAIIIFLQYLNTFFFLFHLSFNHRSFTGESAFINSLTVRFVRLWTHAYLFFLDPLNFPFKLIKIVNNKISEDRSFHRYLI